MPSIIQPTDFAEFENTTRTLGSWDPDTLQRLVPFLAGEQVIVVTDESTGHAVQGEIVGYQTSTVNSQYPHVVILDAHGQRTAYRVSNMGAIMQLGNSPARWNAATAMRDEIQAALRAVRAHLGGIDFPEGTPRKGPRRWTMHLTHRGVAVAWGQSLFDSRWYVDHDGNVTTDR